MVDIFFGEVFLICEKEFLRKKFEKIIESLESEQKLLVVTVTADGFAGFVRQRGFTEVCGCVVEP